MSNIAHYLTSIDEEGLYYIFEEKREEKREVRRENKNEEEKSQESPGLVRAELYCLKLEV